MADNVITLAELFSGSLLHIPEAQEIISVEELRESGSFASSGGVYIFYTKAHEPLYVGISSNISRRTLQHLSKDRGNRDLHKYISRNKGVYVSVFYEEVAAFQEIYESYLIRRLLPRFNVAKTDKQRITCHTKPSKY